MGVSAGKSRGVIFCFSLSDCCVNYTECKGMRLEERTSVRSSRTFQARDGSGLAQAPSSKMVRSSQSSLGCILELKGLLDGLEMGGVYREAKMTRRFLLEQPVGWVW